MHPGKTVLGHAEVSRGAPTRPHESFDSTDQEFLNLCSEISAVDFVKRGSMICLGGVARSCDVDLEHSRASADMVLGREFSGLAALVGKHAISSSKFST